MTDYQFLRVSEEDGVLTVALDRPKANAFNLEMVDELLDGLKSFARDEALRCMVLTGNGRFFSAGQDLQAVREIGQPVPFRRHLQRTYNRVVRDMRAIAKPIVGAINGPAAGAGLGIALATDIRWAGISASFRFGFSGIGLTADSGTSLTLPLHLGLSRASEIAFLNEPLSAEEALDCGLVSRIVPDEALGEAVAELARRLANGPTSAIGLTKRAFNHALLHRWDAILDYEAYLQQIAGEMEDHAEGLRAFLEKRAPNYRRS